MARRPTAPIQLADELIDIDCQPGRTIVTLGSGGAEIRVQLSRHLFRMLVETGRRKADAMEAISIQSAEIIMFQEQRKARRKAR